MVSFGMKIILLAASFTIGLPLASCFTSSRSVATQRLSALSAQSPARREFLQNTAATAVLTFLATQPSIANAAYGESTNIKMPNYIDFLIEKNKQVDPSSVLYKGADIETQLRRIGEAGSRLPEVATLAEEKKWSQVLGIINGPLGTLLQTMNSVADIAGTKEAKDAAKLVKTDLFEIGAAAGQKRSDVCVKAAGKASRDLEKFVIVAFK